MVKNFIIIIILVLHLHSTPKNMPLRQTATKAHAVVCEI